MTSIEDYIVKHGPYHVTKTLLGGEPDVNRRTINDLRTFERVESFNEDMRVWDHEMEAVLQARLKELNGPFLKVMEPVAGIEPASEPYKGSVLPLY